MDQKEAMLLPFHKEAMLLSYTLVSSKLQSFLLLSDCGRKNFSFSLTLKRIRPVCPDCFS
jgi:hypothetical protein